MKDAEVVDGREDGYGLPKDVACLRLGKGSTPCDVVKQVFARRGTFHYDQKTVGLLEVVDQVDHSVDARQPL